MILITRGQLVHTSIGCRGSSDALSRVVCLELGMHDARKGQDGIVDNVLGALKG